MEKSKSSGLFGTIAKILGGVAAVLSLACPALTCVIVPLILYGAGFGTASIIERVSADKAGINAAETGNQLNESAKQKDEMLSNMKRSLEIETRMAHHLRNYIEQQHVTAQAGLGAS
jgi:hypothetical protein